jgi:AcrR family transcriptional regulator
LRRKKGGQKRVPKDIMENCFGLHPVKPRERIISTARDLFRKHGIRGVGVDAIAEAAGTNKMTLYRHFGSKDELVAECLRDVAREVELEWQEVEAASPGDPLAQMREWVHCGAECVHMEDGRGCDMANAAVELADSADHPARQVIEEFKRKQRDRVAQLARAGGITEAELLADTLCLLLEGARVSRQTVGAEGPCAHLIASLDAVIASFQHTCAEAKRAKALKEIVAAKAVPAYV